MLDYFRKLLSKRDQEGASAVEYGLLVAAIAALIVLIVFAFGGLVKNVFETTCDSIANSATGITSGCS